MSSRRSSPQIAATPMAVRPRMPSAITQSCQRGRTTMRGRVARAREPGHDAAMRTAWTLAAVGVAAGKRPAAPKATYYFALEEVQLATGIPGEVGPLARAVLGDTIEKRAGIVTALPADAPDPGKAPQDFKRYLKRKKLRAYRV